MTRRVWVSFLILLFAAARSHSQSPAPSPPAASKPAAKTTAAPGKSPSGQPMTTEIFADEASFDSAKNIGVFTGHVKVNDPRFNIQSDKLTVYIRKGDDEGLEKAVAEGNVGVVRDRPDPGGGPVQRSIGRSDTAVYIASTEDLELRGNPRVQQGINTHIATSPSTVMILNENGQLVTHGPSRTEIRQEPKKETAKQ